MEQEKGGQIIARGVSGVGEREKEREMYTLSLLVHFQPLPEQINNKPVNVYH